MSGLRRRIINRIKEQINSASCIKVKSKDAEGTSGGNINWIGWVVDTSANSLIQALKSVLVTHAYPYEKA